MKRFEYIIYASVLGESDDHARDRVNSISTHIQQIATTSWQFRFQIDASPGIHPEEFDPDLEVDNA